MVAAAMVGSAVVGGVVNSKSAKKGADAQTQAAQIAADKQSAQFAQIAEWLQPYRDAGPGALTAQQNLLGLNGNGAQGSAISALQRSPQFTALLQQGENSILQNASATGGLRGGNTQAALAQFSPALLAEVINQQYSRLGGLTATGAQAATTTGQFGQSASNNISGLLQQSGFASAQGAMGQANAINGAINGVGQGLGYYLSRPGTVGAGAGAGAGMTGAGTMADLSSFGVF